MNPESISLRVLRKKLGENAPDDKKKSLDYSDEELVGLIRDSYRKFYDQVTTVLASDEGYEKTRAEIQAAAGGVNEEAFHNRAAMLWLLQDYADAVLGFYRIQTTHKTHQNALRTAIEIYLIKADTGQLPETLPEGLPKDLFSGKDFDYERTNGGFILRCRSKPDEILKPIEYEFEVRTMDK